MCSCKPTVKLAFARCVNIKKPQQSSTKQHANEAHRSKHSVNGIIILRNKLIIVINYGMSSMERGNRASNTARRPEPRTTTLKPYPDNPEKEIRNVR